MAIKKIKKKKQATGKAKSTSKKTSKITARKPKSSRPPKTTRKKATSRKKIAASPKAQSKPAKPKVKTPKMKGDNFIDPQAEREASSYENPIASRELILQVIHQEGAMVYERLADLGCVGHYQVGFAQEILANRYV